jgi:hypothetical protein
MILEAGSKNRLNNHISPILVCKNLSDRFLGDCQSQSLVHTFVDRQYYKRCEYRLHDIASIPPQRATVWG